MYMKVLFFTRLFWPHVGGIEKHLLELSKLLIKDGHNVTIVTTKFEKSLDSVETYKNIKILRFDQPNVKYFGLIYTWFSLIKYIYLIKESEIVHIHDVSIWY